MFRHFNLTQPPKDCNFALHLFHTDMKITVEEYIRANKALLRQEELERNGGRWIAKDRPHKNIKKYDRKRQKRDFRKYL